MTTSTYQCLADTWLHFDSQWYAPPSVVATAPRAIDELRNTFARQGYSMPPVIAAWYSFQSAIDGVERSKHLRPVPLTELTSHDGWLPLCLDYELGETWGVDLHDTASDPMVHMYSLRHTGKRRVAETSTFFTEFLLYQTLYSLPPRSSRALYWAESGGGYPSNNSLSMDLGNWAPPRETHLSIASERMANDWLQFHHTDDAIVCLDGRPDRPGVRAIALSLKSWTEIDNVVKRYGGWGQSHARGPRGGWKPQRV